jgi:chitinase
VNAGGASFVDPSGQTWAADNGFTGGFTWSTTASVLNTNSSTLYQTCRYAYSFGYTFAVPNGNYNVTLKFAEPSFTLPGQRVFNVALNGTAVLTNFDIVAQAGFLRAIDKTFPVSVSNGAIAIQFSQGSANAPLVSAIEILSQ